ncbi:MAG: acyl-CoA dehydrogenase family protein [Dongiaceae bacterium]
MDFRLSPEIEALRARIAEFIEREVLPIEVDRANWDAHEYIREDVLAGVRAKARAQGLWALHMPKDRGGQGLDTVGMAACYETAARSIFGPAALNIAAPDDGNMFILNRIGTEAQKERWLQPIIDGKLRSSFAMTEPQPGAGSDPAGMMLTRAEKKGDRWIVTGRKWFITGAEGAQHFILIARTSDDPRKGLTAFLFDADQPGWKIERRIPIMGPEEHGGHCELVFDGLEIPDENRLLGVGDGLKVTQIRLGTARLTHCMRWLGFAKRALEIAGAYVAERRSFGTTLAEREGVQWMLGEAAMRIHTGRLLTMHAAWRLDQGHRARKEVSMAKVAVADTLHLAVDTAIQLCGARGYSKDTILEWLYRYARSARLVDGASEVHKMVLSRTLMDEGDEFWRWG